MPDVNVRGVPDEVVQRLREQAEAEGTSFSEWVRLTLAQRTVLPTAAELRKRREVLLSNAQSRDEFDAYYEARLHRRRQ